MATNDRPNRLRAVLRGILFLLTNLIIVPLYTAAIGPLRQLKRPLQVLWCRGMCASAGLKVRTIGESYRGGPILYVANHTSYLYHYHLAPQHIRPRALPQRYVDMGLRPIAGLDVAAVQAELPPLIKGYLRVGGFVGDGAVVDREFNTTDVCVIVNTDQLTGKYERRYKRPPQA